MLGDLIGVFEGKITGVRVLPDGEVETSEQGSGSIIGTKAAWLATSVSTHLPNGILFSEGTGIVTTEEGDVLTIRKSGIGWSTGNGRKASRRGVFFHMTQSQKLAQLNKVVGVWEFESEEDGTWHVKIWEWK